MKFRLARVGGVKQDVKGQKVIDRTNGGKENHEIPDEFHIPSSGGTNRVLVNIIGWDCDLCRVIKEVVQQDLRRKHGQKREKHRCACHAEHVAEVRTSPH